MQNLPVCEIIDRADPGWDATVVRLLRESGEVARARSLAASEPRSARIRDIVLTGSNDDDLAARSLKRLLDAEFSEERLEFRVKAAFGPRLPQRAFFGHGVFAPDPDDRCVANLQFAWTVEPSLEDVVTPRLGGANPQDDPAAWYVGQHGVVVGFDQRWVPAVIARTSAPPENPAVAALDDVVLFFGRRSAHGTPVVETHIRGGDLPADAVSRFLQHPRDWWLRNGEWQSLEIRVAQKGAVHLWFRVTGRTGRVNFRVCGKERRRAGPQAAGGRPGRPILILRGLILPEPVSLLRVVSGFLGGRVSRVVVDFDRQNRLRTNEIAEFGRSVVLDRGNRFAVWRHDPPGSWVDRSRSLAGWQDLEIAEGERVELLNFPLSWPKDQRERRRTIRLLYGRKTHCLLQFDDDEAQFGWFAIGASGILSGRSVASGDREEGDAGADDLPKISLDWLNLAVHVVRGGQKFGVAELWEESLKPLGKTVISADADRLVVRVGRADRSVEYTIGIGERGPLGPLYVEYGYG